MSEEFEKDYQAVIKAEKKFMISAIAAVVLAVVAACIWANIYF